jgi:CubicO group peptidase (beta-lactamase class C family)
MSRISRRKFLRTTSLWAALLAGSRELRADPDTAPFASFDREVEAFMTARKVPGGALAVVKDHRLVYARGYGWADREKKVPVTPESLFRIASVSKPITGLAVVKLAEQGRLNLDARAFDLVRLDPPKSKEPDPRLARITVRQLLHHTGGWDRDKSFDPMFRPILIAKALKETAPAGPASVIRYMMGEPLDFDPGTRFVYSNFGYCVLGRIIERLTGVSYVDYVRKKHSRAPGGDADADRGQPAGAACAGRGGLLHEPRRDGPECVPPRAEAGAMALWRFPPRGHGCPWGLDCLGGRPRSLGRRAARSGALPHPPGRVISHSL